MSAGRVVASAVDLEFNTRDGFVRQRLNRCAAAQFELECSPVRNFPSFRGQRNYPGLWWFATTGTHVGCRSSCPALSDSRGFRLSAMVTRAQDPQVHGQGPGRVSLSDSPGTEGGKSDSYQVFPDYSQLVPDRTAQTRCEALQT